MKLSRQETITLTENKVTNSMVLEYSRTLVVVCMPSGICLFALVSDFYGMRLWVAVIFKIKEPLVESWFPDIVLPRTQASQPL